MIAPIFIHANVTSGPSGCEKDSWSQRDFVTYSVYIEWDQQAAIEDAGDARRH